jgi:hypothetical protein
MPARIQDATEDGEEVPKENLLGGPALGFIVGLQTYK